MAIEDISGDCIKEINSIIIDVVSSMLATVPIGIHHSSLGYTMAQVMSAMVKEKVILKNSFKMPRHIAKKLKSIGTYNTITRDNITLHLGSS